MPAILATIHSSLELPGTWSATCTWGKIANRTTSDGRIAIGNSTAVGNSIRIDNETESTYWANGTSWTGGAWTTCSIPDRSQRRSRRSARVKPARGISKSRAARAARLIPQRPSNPQPTPAIPKGSSPETQTVTIPEAPKTPPAQRDLSPEPSPTLKDIGALEKATGQLTI
ncbi:hypothetical protein F4811DRAFT_570483 [Daldinia bambusicola]|nr:hypothetical protein F4811DRAFT_570483 [Daldinia bambusicola]